MLSGKIGWVGLLLSAGALTWALAQEFSGNPYVGYSRVDPEDRATRLAWIEDDPAYFAVMFDSALVTVDWSDPARSRHVEEAADLYLEVTGDSLLLRDVAFVRDLEEADRDDWYDAVLLDDEGFLQRANGEYAASAENYVKAAIAYDAVGDLRRSAVAWGSAGVSLWYTGDFSGVVRHYRSALEARRRLGDPELIGKTLNGLGSAHFRMNQYREALDYYEQARVVREKLDDQNDLATTVTYLGNTYKEFGELDRARAHYEKAREILGGEGSDTALGRIDTGLGNVHTLLGEYPEAAAAYRRVIARMEAAGSHDAVAVNRRNLAYVLLSQGRYAEARKELEQARDEQAGNAFELAATLNTIGIVHLSEGNHRLALTAFQEAKGKAEEGNNQAVLTDAIANRASTYFDMGLLDRSLEAFAEAFSIYEEEERVEGMRNALKGMANAHWGKKEHEEALRLHERAAAIDAEYALRDYQAESHTDVANVLVDLGRLDEAAARYEAAIAAAEETGNLELLWPAHLGLADCRERAGDLKGAARHLREALALIERLRSGVLSAESKAAFLDRIAYVYETLVHVLAKRHGATGRESFAREAFEVSEEGKARALLDALESSDVDETRTLPPALRGEYQRAERALTSARYRLRKAVVESSPEVKALKREVRGYERDLERVRQEIELETAASGRLGSPRDLTTLRESLLNPGSVLLAYALGDSASYLWVLTRSDLEMHALPARPDIDGRVEKLRAALVRPGDEDATGWEPLASELAGTVLAPALDDLRGVNRLLLIPDGILNEIPFSVVLESLNLGSRPEITYGPSATTLSVLSGRERSQEPTYEFLGVADPLFQPEGSQGELVPLPATRDEVEAARALFDPDRVRVLVGDGARETVLREDGFLGQFRILHLATHGLIDERRPERSSLALAYPRDDREDGYLRASEIYELRLNADLVVLSACETGLGKRARGEGVLGLPRAFFYAGAPTVVVSLWSVSDESTALLMTELYRRMVENGEAPARALAGAQAALRTRPEFAHPFFWAPFVVLGS